MAKTFSEQANNILKEVMRRGENPQGYMEQIEKLYNVQVPGGLEMKLSGTDIVFDRAGINDMLQYTASGFGDTYPQIPGRNIISKEGYISVSIKRNELQEAQETIKELQGILEGIQKEPLLLQRVERMSKDGKHAFVKKGDTELRIETVKDLAKNDEVLLHPKTYQIVERLGKPPLEISRFSPDTIPDVHWSDIGGLEEAKADLIEAIEVPHLNKKLFTHYGKKQIKGILLSGSPGCGKTMLGKAAANALATIHQKKGARSGFLYIKGPEILNQYVGQTEQTIQDMFYDAKRHKEEHGYPAIIFLDEADAILATRGTRNVGIGNTIVPMFLTEMDGLEESGAIVIIATNRPDVLDPAIVRDGRIDRKIHVTRPDINSGTEILRMNLAGVPLLAGLDVTTVAKDIAEMLYADTCQVKAGLLLREIVNGAMLANCVNMAVSFAMRRDMAEGTVSGVSVADLHNSVHRIIKQSASTIHDLPDTTPEATLNINHTVSHKAAEEGVSMMPERKLN